MAPRGIDTVGGDTRHPDALWCGAGIGYPERDVVEVEAIVD